MIEIDKSHGWSETKQQISILGKQIINIGQLKVI